MSEQKGSFQRLVTIMDELREKCPWDRKQTVESLRPLTIEGKTLHHVGIPIHCGFMGLAKPGFIANTLTPVVGDANSQTPEFKSFLVKVEKL